MFYFLFDEARRIAVNIAKPEGFLSRWRLLFWTCVSPGSHTLAEYGQYDTATYKG